MFVRQPSTTAVPSRGALRVLRQLALAGSTIGAIGSLCTVATITYDVHRRVQVAERIVENKRCFQSVCPNYNAAGGAMTMARMMEAAEAGEFLGLESLKGKERKQRRKMVVPDEGRPAEQKQEASAEPKDRRNPTETGGPLLRDGTPSEHTMFDPMAHSILTYKPSTSEALNKHTVKTENPSGRAKSLQEMNRVKILQVEEPLVTRPHRLTSLSKFRLLYQDHQPVPVSVQVQKLLRENNPIEAAQQFLQAYSATSDDILDDQKGLAVELFYANLKAENVFLARNIFQWIESNDKISPAVWEIMMLALAKNGSIESLATIFLSYSAEFELSPTLIEMVLRALIDSYRLNDAKSLIFKNLVHDRSCGLCGIYLDGVWKKSRDPDLVDTQLRNLLSSLTDRGMPITEKLFDPLLKAYIESGMEEKAQLLVEEMKTTYKVPLRMRTLGLLLYEKALKCDWAAVEHGLQEISHLKLSTLHPKRFAKAFDRVFLEFWLANPGHSIRDFVFRAIEDYGLVPDKVLFDHIIRAFVEKGTPEMITDFMEIVKTRSWRLTLDRESFLEVVRHHRLSCEMSPVGLWQTFRASEAKFGHMATSQRILGYDRTSFPNDEAYKMPWTHEPAMWWRRAMSMSNPSRNVDQFLPLHKQMIHCMNAGRMGDAVRLYQTAKEAGKFMKQLHIELAVTASIMHHGFTQEAKMILEEEECTIRTFKSAVTPIFFQEVLQADSVGEVEALKLAVFNFYSILERRLMPFKHHMAVSASAQLIKKGKSKAAIELLRTIHKSRYAAATPFDSVAVKILARAFSVTGNLKGIRWAIFTGLKRASVLGRDLLVEILRIIAELKSRPNIPADQAGDAFRLYVKHLEKLSGCLSRKFESGNQTRQRNVYSSPESKEGHEEQPNTVLRWITDSQIKPRRRPAQAVRSDDDLAHDISQMGQIVEQWRERAELEKALMSSPVLQTGEDEDWSENTVWEDHVQER